MEANAYLSRLMHFRNNCRNLLIGGTLLILMVKFLIRPYLHPGGAAGFLLGVAPNLVGSFLLPFGVHWLQGQPLFFRERLTRYAFFFETRTVCLIGFGLLVVNEYLQLVPFFGRRFDYFDILSSAVGLTLSYYAFSVWQRRRVVSG